MSERFLVRSANGSEYGPVEMGVLRQWAAQGRISPGAVLAPDGGGPEIPASEHTELAPILNAPPTVRGAIPDEPKGDATGGLIPYKNKPALIGYYLGIFSVLFALLLAPIGAIMGIVSIVLGIKGLRLRSREPEVKGSVHAIIALIGGGIAILFGSLMSVVWIAVIFGD